MKILKKLKLNQKGFSHLELVFLIIVGALISGMGYYVYTSQHNNSPTANAGSYNWQKIGSASGLSTNPHAHSNSYEACVISQSANVETVYGLTSISPTLPSTSYTSGYTWYMRDYSDTSDTDLITEITSHDWWGGDVSELSFAINPKITNIINFFSPGMKPQGGLAVQINAQQLQPCLPLAATKPTSSPPTKLPTSVSCGKVNGPFRVTGSEVLQSNGESYVPYGVTLSELQYSNYDSSSAVATQDAQISAAATNWCSNTIRLQVEQDQLVGLNGDSYNSDFMKAIVATVSYAEKLHMIVVINDQTEGTFDPSTTTISTKGTTVTNNEPLPTMATEAFWHDINNVYKNDPQVVYDLFNEPRSNNYSQVSDWSLWKYGGEYQGKTYLGMQSLSDYIRSDGSNNLIWVEGIYNDGTLDLLPKYLLSGNGPIAYSIHHPLASPTGLWDANNDRNTDNSHENKAIWSQDFGFLVEDHIAPVVDGEWTNYAQTLTVQTSPECWPNAPEDVPAYLDYLSSLGIGMTVWTLQDGVMTSAASNYNSPTHIGSNWSCSSGLNQGAGVLIQNWYHQQNS